MAGSMAQRAKWLMLCKPQFRLFFCLVSFCCTFLYIVLTTNVLEIQVDPDKDAAEVKDGVCRISEASSMVSERDLINCIHPHQFTFDTIQKVHKTPLLTLFSFSSEGMHKNGLGSHLSSDIQMTMQNLDTLRPWIIPVLFTPCWRGLKNNFMEIDQNNSLCVIHNRDVLDTGIKLVSGTVVIQDLFAFITNHSRYSAPFVGYVHPGTLVDFSIIESLMYVSRLPTDTLQGQGLLVIGRAKFIESVRLLSSQLKNLSYVEDIYNKRPLRNTVDRLPYMITTRTGYPWNLVRKEAALNPSIINYMAAYGLVRNVTTIDSTHSLRCIRRESQRTDNTETPDLFCGNQSLNGKQVLTSGQTNCAPYFTKRDQNGAIVLYKRKNRLQQCLLGQRNSLFIC